MSNIIHGNADFASDKISLVREEFVTNPQIGPTKIQEWHGLKTQLIDKLNEISGSVGSGNCRLYPLAGALWSLVATYTGSNAVAGGQDPFDEAAWDKWSIHTNVLEKEIWTHPFVYAAAVAYDSTNPNDFRRQIENYSKEEDPDYSPAVMASTAALPAPYSSYQVYQVAEMVLKELARGASHFEDEYLTLRRTRIITTNYPAVMPIYSVRYVYQTAQLPVPGNLMFSLPTFPANPTQATWGWRLRTQQSDWMGPLRVEQVFEWVLAAWSTLLYSPATENFPY